MASHGENKNTAIPPGEDTVRVPGLPRTWRADMKESDSQVQHVLAGGGLGVWTVTAARAVQRAEPAVGWCTRVQRAREWGRVGAELCSLSSTPRSCAHGCKCLLCRKGLPSGMHVSWSRHPFHDLPGQRVAGPSCGLVERPVILQLSYYG